MRPPLSQYRMLGRHLHQVLRGAGFICKAARTSSNGRNMFPAGNSVIQGTEYHTCKIHTHTHIYIYIYIYAGPSGRAV